VASLIDIAANGVRSILIARNVYRLRNMPETERAKGRFNVELQGVKDKKHNVVEGQRGGAPAQSLTLCVA
jgi:hypothetical protein